MNATGRPREPDRIVAAWLADGPDDLPEELGHSIAIAARTLPQARNRLDRFARRIDMSRYQTLGLVAAVAIVAVVGVVALAAFRGGNAGVGGQPLGTATATAAPTASASSPVLTQTFTSPWYGYSIRHPADWEAIQAQGFFEPAQFAAQGGPSEWLDVIHPTTSDGLFRAGSAAIPEGGSVDDVLRAYWGIQSDLEDVSIGGQPARLRDGDGEVEAAAVVGDRVYVFTLFSGDGAIQNDRGVFDALMASVEFHPEDAVAAPSPTPAP
jgi:hypothetical protein